MGERPVNAAPDAGGWRLGPGIAKDVQGFVVSAFSDLDGAEALFLYLGRKPPGGKPRGGAWIAALRSVVPITRGTGPQAPAAMLAFTRTGLDVLGLPEKAVETFPLPFQEGMMQADRRRRLGDAATDKTAEGAEVPLYAPVWSANTPQQEAESTPGLKTKVDDGLLTPTEVHALLIVYDKDHETAEKLADRCAAALTAAKVEVKRRLRLELHADGRGIPHEHFGFADGVSQPIPFGAGVVTKAGTPFPRDPLHGVPLGEILMGYPDAHGETPPRPVVAGPDRVGQNPADADAAAAVLEASGAAGLSDLGLNGSYLVVRELEQDVPAFWASLDREAEALSEGNPVSPITAEALAAKVVGRDRDGNVLRPKGPLPPVAVTQPDGKTVQLPDNDFAFLRDDRYGDGCPIGSHVRRANPRDTLAAKDKDAGTLLRAANNHRILRRGRKYGELLPDPRVGDGARRGLLFLALNTDIVRQFEFIQQNWLLNPTFGTILGQVDPLVGPAGPMTLPGEPLRRVFDVQTYIKLVGGDYFFLPSIKVLDYLESLPPPTDDPEAGG